MSSKSLSVVPGSLQSVAQGANKSLAESFLSAKAIVIFDSSASMEECDDQHQDKEGHWKAGKSRYEKALDALADLQAENPGKLAIINFSDSVEFCPGGAPRLLGGTTDLASALKFVSMADGTVRYFVISDGEPDDADLALSIVAGWQSRIDCIYIGPKGGRGAQFLKRLAEKHGGSFAEKKAAELESGITLLLKG